MRIRGACVASNKHMSRQLPMFPTAHSGSKLIVSYGGGINTIALLLELKRLGQRPDAIIMANPGSEWPETVDYRERIANPWLESIGWPTVTVVTLNEESKYRPRAKEASNTTLYQECIQHRNIPSIAYGYKKCSDKYKGRATRWYLERQAWVQEVWDRGEKITRATGYDADEEYRVNKASMPPQEALRFVPYYPLVNAGIDREECERIIIESGLPIPHKSACTFCPSNTLAEWGELRRVHPELHEEAVAMSRNAEIDSPDIVGLMRCNRPGYRQLHLYVYPSDHGGGCDTEEDRDALPCECAL